MLAILVVAVIVSLIFSSALGRTVDNLLGNNQSATALRSQIHYYAVQCSEMENGEEEFERLVDQALQEENYRYELRKNGAYCYSNLDILDVGFISEYRFYMDREDSFTVTGQQEALIKHAETIGNSTYELIAVNQNYLENAVYYSQEDVNAIDSDQLALISVIVVLSIIIVALTAVIITHTLSSSILRPLQKLKVASRKIKDGNFNFHLHSDGSDELADLCNDFDEMRRRLQESVELQLAYEQEEKNLVAGMAHDLRTPITSIKGYIEGLRDGVANTPEKQKRYLDTLAVKTEDLNRLVDSLFLFSKLDTGKYPHADQKYRFELCRNQTDEHSLKKLRHGNTTELILEFLDLDDNESRAEFLQKHQAQIDSRFLTAAAESLEFTERAETLEERYAALLRFLRTKMRYEGGRLR